VVTVCRAKNLLPLSYKRTYAISQEFCSSELENKGAPQRLRRPFSSFYSSAGAGTVSGRDATGSVEKDSEEQ